ncbi:hypothetical protein QZN17_17250 [Burkholderia multivorans]|nr:hypothetical protein [Burkholderia multivorans]
MPVAQKTVRCIDCAHYQLKDAGAMGRLGFGLCALSPSRASFPSSVYPRQCDKFSEAAADVRAARTAWLDKRGEG